MKHAILFFLLVVGVLISPSVFSQAKDTLELKNGQTLVGTFLGWRNDDISFSIAGAGVITVDYHRINKLQAKSSNFRIETSKRKVFYDQLTCVTSGEFMFREDSNTVSIPFKYMELIVPYTNGGTVEGFISLGHIFSQSLDFGLVSIEGGLNYNSKQWKIDGDLNSNLVFTKSTGVERNREVGRVVADRILSPYWHFSNRYIYQRNSELGLAYRHLVGTGPVWNTIRKPNFHINFSLQLAGTFESTFDKQTYRRLEIPLLLDVTLYNLGKGNLSLAHTQALYIGTGATRRIRHDGELRLNMQLTKSLSLSTYLYDNYDSDLVQKIGTDNFDYGWNTSLTLNF